MHHKIDQCTVLPLFPKVCGYYTLDQDISDLNKLKSFEYKPVEPTKLVLSTEDFNVLEKFPTIKKLLLDKFNHFKDMVLRMWSQDFKISTSWGTQVLPNGRSYTHNHRNSFYSGVLYWEDFEGARLEFEDYTNQGFLVLPNQWTDLNHQQFHFNTVKNCLIFFPSILHHRVSTNLSNNTRYSLAFNIWPIGSFGHNDSFVTVDVLSKS